MTIDKQKIARSFSEAALKYEQAAILQRHIGQEMLQRLAWMDFKPKRIVDLGCGTGLLTRALAKQYKKSHVIGIDIAQGMLQVAKQHKSWFHNPDYIQGDAETLPLADESVDLIFSSFALQWCHSLEQAFREIYRVLTPHGVLMFSMPSAGSLTELAQSWQQVDTYQHVNPFVDMHALGDLLWHQGFLQPVMDKEHHQLYYPDVMALMRDLKTVGAQQVEGAKNPGLTSRTRLQQLSAAYEKFRAPNGQLPLSYHVVYGHAWGKKSITSPDLKQVIQVVAPLSE